MTAKGIPATSRRAVAERSGGRCEVRIRGVCTGRAVHLHHVQRRDGGDHSPSNLLHVCRRCHDHVHAHPAWAREHGFIRSAFTPTKET
ncbi:MAG: HNH endonuclease [Acidimicrobiia bacterium]